jgi:hypothetical protein
MAHAHLLMTWFNVNRTRQTSDMCSTTSAETHTSGAETCAVRTCHRQSHQLRAPSDGGAPTKSRGCGDAHTACCVRVWCLIALPLGRGWVCVWLGASGRGGGGGAGSHALRGEGETSTNTVCPQYPGLSGMVRISDVPLWTKSAGTIPPLPCPVCLNELQVCVRMRMRMGVYGYACACARA